jgi:hypothetical protein
MTPFRRLLPVVAVLALAACAAPGPRPVSEAGAPAAPLPASAAAVPAHDQRHAIAWVQTATEYEALARMVFQGARHRLDPIISAARADQLREWSAMPADEFLGNDGGQPPAVIFDLDETLLDNSAYQRRQMLAGAGYDTATWLAWSREARARAAARRRRDRLDHDRVAQRSAQSLAEPGDDATGEDQRPGQRERDQGLAGRRQRVAGDHQRLAPPEAIGDVPGDHAGEALRRVGDALDHPEGRGRDAEHREESRQHHRRRLVAQVAERAGEPRAEHGAVEPARACGWWPRVRGSCSGGGHRGRHRRARSAATIER